MQSALLTNFKVLLALLFRDIVHQISKLIFYVTHISASFPTHRYFLLAKIMIYFYISSLLYLNRRDFIKVPTRCVFSTC